MLVNFTPSKKKIKPPPNSTKRKTSSSFFISFFSSFNCSGCLHIFFYVYFFSVRFAFIQFFTTQYFPPSIFILPFIPYLLNIFFLIFSTGKRLKTGNIKNDIKMCLFSRLLTLNVNKREQNNNNKKSRKSFIILLS